MRNTSTHPAAAAVHCTPQSPAVVLAPSIAHMFPAKPTLITRLRRTLYLGAGLAMIVLTLLALQSCGGEEKVAEAQPIRPVRYGVIALSDGIERQSYTGLVTAGEEAELSFRVSGTLRDVKVKLGDRVRRGQLIASVDPQDFAVQSRQASAQAQGSAAQVQSAETQLIQARSAYRRIEQLYENNSVSLSEFEQARGQFEAAQSSLAAAKAQAAASGQQVAAARNQVSYTRLTAPFDGIITQLMAADNEYFASGKVVAVLSSEGDPEVEVSVPEGLIGGVRVGDSVDINLPALPQQRLRGIVSEVAYAAGDSPSYPVVIRLGNPPSTLRPGMAAAASFRVMESGKAGRVARLIAPVEAVSEGPQGKFVFLLKPSADAGKGAYEANRQVITIGKLYDEGFEVLSGLEAGDYVATAGLSNLLDGMAVQLLGGRESEGSDVDSPNSKVPAAETVLVRQ